MSPAGNKIVRYASGLLLLIVALNAFAGGWYGMAGARDVPLEWLDGSPFRSYLVPGILLFTVVGMSAFIASVLVFIQHRYASNMAFAAGLIIVCWIAAQVAIIGYVSWLQPAVGSAGVITMLLAYALKRQRKAG